MNPVIGMNPMPALETPRLMLRPYEATDIDDMAAMFGDREVTAYTFLGYRTREQTQAVLDEYMAFQRERAWGMLAILDRSDGRYLGEVGLFVAPMGMVALRYALARSGWNKGYATEASAAVIDDTFGRLKMEKLYAGVKPENVPSVRVVEKLGFVWEYDTTTHGHSFGMFGLTPEIWKARRAA